MSTDHHPPETEPEAAAELRAAAESYREAEAAVEEHGRERLEDLADAHRDAIGLLLEYRDTATDTGTQEFVNFANFEHKFTSLVEGLDEDLPARDAFEAARRAVDKTRLSESDFDAAQAALEPAGDLIERLDAIEAARDDLRDARERATERRSELEAEVAERERIRELGAADLDAPIEDLREPNERWNEAVRDAVTELRTDASAREAFAVLERAERYPLVDLPTPPERLATYVAENPAGEESIARLLEFADFSRSKLDHYVDDAAACKRAVATERTFLEEFDGERLTVSWPPPPAERVPWRARELRGIVGGLVGEEALAALRRVVAIARDRDRYERLRSAAIAESELDADARARLEAGEISDEIDRRRAAIERIDAALDAAPDP